jgi:uncharacterized protein
MMAPSPPGTPGGARTTPNLLERFLPVTITPYDQLITTFSLMLTNLDKVLTKAEADAATRKIDAQVLITARLAPDMLPLVRQVQITTDQAKGGASRLAGQESPKWPDDEQSFADLHERIAKTLAHLRTFKPEDFEGLETRSIELKFPNASFSFTGRDYFLNFVVPNFYFHYTTAYAILRHNGVPIGKSDFLGGR